MLETTNQHLMKQSVIKSMFTALGCAALVGASACDRKETVFEMETPAGKIEVEKDKDSGAVEVEVDGNE